MHCNVLCLYHKGSVDFKQISHRFTCNATSSQAGAVEGDFALAISLFHAYELVQLHGLRSFHQFLRTTFSSGSSSKQSMARRDIIRSPLFSGIMRQLTENLQGSSSDSVDSTAHFPITIGTSSNSEERDHKSGREFFYSHPKLQKLEEVVLEHFSSFKDDSGSLQKPADTRVMIFSQYRESVQEISDMLGRHTPLVKAMTFVGHSSGKSTSKGLTQKEQTEVSCWVEWVVDSHRVCVCMCMFGLKILERVNARSNKLF